MEAPAGRCVRFATPPMFRRMRLRGMAKQKIISKGYEQGALSAGCAVGAAKVADHRETRSGGQQGRVQPLNRVGRGVIKGLSVGCDGCNVARKNFRRRERLARCQRNAVRPRGRGRPVPSARPRRRAERENALPQIGGIRFVKMPQQPCGNVYSAPADRDRRCIDAVGARSAHGADKYSIRHRMKVMKRVAGGQACFLTGN